MNLQELPRGPFDAAGVHSTNRLRMTTLRRPLEVSLTGPWDFQLRGGQSADQDGEWTCVDVPELWTMRAGSGDRPHYTNVPMPFDEVFPDLPAKNPTGVYRRVVDLRPVEGERLILHIGAAEGYLRVSVNKTPVGTSTDSHLHAEFDITGVVRAGPNTIELAVTKWSAMTYLEDQDQWWHSGLSRSVGIYSVPEIRLHDVVAVADFDAERARGSLRLDVSTVGLRGSRTPGHQVRVGVGGTVVTEPVAIGHPAPTIPAPARDRSVSPPQTLPDDYMDVVSLNAAAAPLPPELRANPDGAWWLAHQATGTPGTAVLEVGPLDVVPWSAEDPHLEKVSVQLLDPAGQVVDAVSLRVGFRRVEIVGRELRVNGRPILIQGVNRHDFDPHTGRVMSQERMVAELSLLKKFNVNAIRTSHYPNDPAFLDLCDEFGFYVVDEADIEAHAFASTLASDPLYLPEIIERTARMLLRDRNHPSVIIWSLGNESGYHAVHDAAAAWVRRTDPTRPVQYEGAIAADWYAGRRASDIVAPMYPSWASLEAYSQNPAGDRPLILCEYAYSQGNSTGGFDRYWQLFETLPGLQGGFIWQFVDHALDPDRSGRGRYGGDFGDEPNSGTTLLNGVVFADLTPKPAFYEVRSIFSPVRLISSASDLKAGVLRIKNRQTFQNLQAYELALRVETMDGPVASIRIAAPNIPAGGEGDIAIPAALREQLSSPRALGLTATLQTTHDRPWAPAGTEVAMHNLATPRHPGPLPAPVAPAATNDRGALTHPLMSDPPRLCLWRALTDNDMSAALDQRFVRTGHFSLTEVDAEVSVGSTATKVVTTYRAAFGDEIIHRRSISAAGVGDFVIDEHVTLPDGPADLLRVGMTFELVAGFDHVDWIGLGPWENYPDRRHGAVLGRWSCPIAEMSVPYLRPQENGTRGDVAWLEIAGPAGRAQIIPERPAHINVSRYHIADLESADHWWELTPRDTTVVHVDTAHRGTGTGRLGPDTAAEFRIIEREHRWRWRLRMVSVTTESSHNGATIRSLAVRP